MPPANPVSQFHIASCFVFFLTVALTVASRRGQQDDDDDDEEEGKVFWENVIGLVVIGVICLIGAGLFSLCAWLFFSCYERFNKRRVVNSSMPVTRPGKLPSSSLPPEWSRHLVIQPELGVGFGLVSEGFLRLSTAQIVRQRPGSDVTDGATWAAPLNTGKHLFEIIWPWGCRGYGATVGVATRDAPLKQSGSTLVGGNKSSWGLDIVKRRVMHYGKTICACPTDGSYVPDRFMMYVDVDEGAVGFGNDVTFWGNVITNLPRGKPLYPMVGSNKWEANIQVFYRGSAGTSGFDPHVGQAPAYTIPSAPGPMPPAYGDVYNKPDRPRSAWEPMPPPTPFPGPTPGPSYGGPSSSAPVDAPPPYASPSPTQLYM